MGYCRKVIIRNICCYGAAAFYQRAINEGNQEAEELLACFKIAVWEMEKKVMIMEG